MTYNIDLQNNNIGLQEILETINNLPEAGGSGGGIQLPNLPSPASASEIFKSKQAFDQEGNILVGTYSIDSELNTQEALLAELESLLHDKL